MREAIDMGEFGAEIKEIYDSLSDTEKQVTQENLYWLYGSREQIYAFAAELSCLLPECVSFRNRSLPKDIYLWIRKRKQKSLEKRLAFTRKLFLPVGYKLHIAWEYPFIIIGMSYLDSKNCLDGE